MGVFNETIIIIPIALAGYEMIIANKLRCILPSHIQRALME